MLETYRFGTFVVLTMTACIKGSLFLKRILDWTQSGLLLLWSPLRSPIFISVLPRESFDVVAGFLNMILIYVFSLYLILSIFLLSLFLLAVLTKGLTKEVTLSKDYG